MLENGYGHGSAVPRTSWTMSNIGLHQFDLLMRPFALTAGMTGMHNSSSLPMTAAHSSRVPSSPPSPPSTPADWTREDVRRWLGGAVVEYGLDPDLPNRFPMNGKGLCMLSKEDFRLRAPDAGDVLYNSFHSLLQSPQRPTSNSPFVGLGCELSQWRANWGSESTWPGSCVTPVSGLGQGDWRKPEALKMESDVEDQLVNDQPLNLKVIKLPPEASDSFIKKFPFKAASDYDEEVSDIVDQDLVSRRLAGSKTRSQPFFNRPIITLPLFPDNNNNSSRIDDAKQKMSFVPYYRPLPASPQPFASSSPPPSLLSLTSSVKSSAASSVTLPFLGSPPMPRRSLVNLSPISCVTSGSPRTAATPPRTASTSEHLHCLLPVSGSYSPQLMKQDAAAAAAAVASAGLDLVSAAHPTSYERSPVVERVVEAAIPHVFNGENAEVKYRTQPMQVSMVEEHQKTQLNLSTSDRLLWKFLAELLNRNTTKCISWEDQQHLTFQIVDPDELAELWGVEKCKPGMTYEKLSRALRYYYKMNIIAKVPGKRLTYRFITSPQLIKKGKRGAKPGVPHKRRNLPQSTKPIKPESH